METSWPRVDSLIFPRAAGTAMHRPNIDRFEKRAFVRRVRKEKKRMEEEEESRRMKERKKRERRTADDRGKFPTLVENVEVAALAQRPLCETYTRKRIYMRDCRSK